MHEIVAAAHDALSVARLGWFAAKKIEQSLKRYGTVDYEDYIGILTLRNARRERYEFNPESPFGELFLKIQANDGFSRIYGLGCCRLSETNLSRSLELIPYNKTPWTEESKGPLVLITHADKVVAVQKNIGEPSVYGLEDVPEIGVFSKVISAPNVHIRPSKLAHDSEAVAIDSSHYEKFLPKRIAQTVFSMEARSAVNEPEAFLQEGLHVSHEAILARVAEISRIGVENIVPPDPIDDL